MGAGWTAGVVRARGMLHRRLGREGARRLAAAPSLAAATELLAGGSYGRGLGPEAREDLEATQRAIAGTLLWRLRVLAGWQPSAGAVLLRVLAGWFEVVDTIDHVRALFGTSGSPPPFRLGALRTAAPVAASTSPEELRDALARSAWRDPGGAAPAVVATGMQLAWADRVARTAPAAQAWAAGGAALVWARDRSAGRAATITGPAATRLLGASAVASTTWPDFVAALPAHAAWPLIGLEPAALWQADRRWWSRLESDAQHLLRAGSGPEPLLGSAGLLAADARLVSVALTFARRGGVAAEAFDAVA